MPDDVIITATLAPCWPLPSAVCPCIGMKPVPLGGHCPLPPTSAQCPWKPLLSPIPPEPSIGDAGLDQAGLLHPPQAFWCSSPECSKTTGKAASWPPLCSQTSPLCAFIVYFSNTAPEACVCPRIPRATWVSGSHTAFLTSSRGCRCWNIPPTPGFSALGFPLRPILAGSLLGVPLVVIPSLSWHFLLASSPPPEGAVVPHASTWVALVGGVHGRAMGLPHSLPPGLVRLRLRLVSPRFLWWVSSVTLAMALEWPAAADHCYCHMGPGMATLVLSCWNKAIS